MKIKISLTAFLMATGLFMSAQNLVENGSFEILDKKPKEPGEIFLAPPWQAATKAIPDLYSKDAKNELIKVPKNAYGDEEAKEGENYAGLLIYSEKEKEPRSYLFTRLKYPMLAGEHYCVKFNISFADMSKYASNNIGCYVSSDSTVSETELILKFQPQIINSTNRVFEKQWLWEDICRIYVANGGEQYLTIGNFAPQLDIITKSVKRPTGYTQAQIRDGYYFIDDVSVLPNATPENCKCEPGNFAFANMNKQEAEFATDEADIPDKVIIGTTGTVHNEAVKITEAKEDVVIQFELGKDNLTAAETAKLDQVVVYMKSNAAAKLKLVGHSDAGEKVMTGISAKRLSQVQKYLISKGISDKVITSEDAGDTKPIDASGSKENRYKNMVVEIKFS